MLKILSTWWISKIHYKNVGNTNKNQTVKIAKFRNKILNFQYFENFNLKISQKLKLNNLIKFKNERKSCTITPASSTIQFSK